MDSIRAWLDVGLTMWMLRIAGFIAGWYLADAYIGPWLANETITYQGIR